MPDGAGRSSSFTLCIAKWSQCGRLLCFLLNRAAETVPMTEVDDICPLQTQVMDCVRYNISKARH